MVSSSGRKMTFVFNDVIYQDDKPDMLFSKNERFRHENEVRVVSVNFSPIGYQNIGRNIATVNTARLVGDDKFLLELPVPCFEEIPPP